MTRLIPTYHIERSGGAPLLYDLVTERNL